MDWKAKTARIRELVDRIRAEQGTGREAAISTILDLASKDEALTFDLYRAVLDLCRNSEIPAQELEPHTNRVLALWNQLHARAKSLQRDSPGNEWMLDGEYRKVRALGGVILDLLGCLPGSEVTEALREGVSLVDPRLKMFAVISLLRRLEPVDPAEMERVAASNEVRILLWRELCKLNMTNLMPKEWSTPEKLAASDLVHWAAHPMELGTAPEEIELMLEKPFEDDQGRVFSAYLFRFREYPKPWEPGEGWMAGVAGPFLNGRALASPWSSFERWDSRSPEEHFTELFQRASSCVAAPPESQ